MCIAAELSGWAQTDLLLFRPLPPPTPTATCLQCSVSVHNGLLRVNVLNLVCAVCIPITCAYCGRKQSRHGLICLRTIIQLAAQRSSNPRMILHHDFVLCVTMVLVRPSQHSRFADVRTHAFSRCTVCQSKDLVRALLRTPDSIEVEALVDMSCLQLENGDSTGVSSCTRVR